MQHHEFVQEHEMSLYKQQNEASELLSRTKEQHQTALSKQAKEFESLQFKLVLDHN
jgi:hypothetical protein